MSNRTLFLICLMPALVSAFSLSTLPARMDRYAAFLGTRPPTSAGQRELLLTDAWRAADRSLWTFRVIVGLSALMTLFAFLFQGSFTGPEAFAHWWQIPVVFVFIGVLPALVIYADVRGRYTVVEEAQVEVLDLDPALRTKRQAIFLRASADSGVAMARRAFVLAAILFAIATLWSLNARPAGVPWWALPMAVFLAVVIPADYITRRATARQKRAIEETRLILDPTASA